MDTPESIFENLMFCDLEDLENMMALYDADGNPINDEDITDLPW